jgi:hypothetical protein
VLVGTNSYWRCALERKARSAKRDTAPRRGYDANPRVRTSENSVQAKFAEFTSLLKNSPVAAYEPQNGPKNVDLGPLEPLYAPINAPGSSFSTGSGVLRSSAVLAVFVTIGVRHAPVGSA